MKRVKVAITGAAGQIGYSLLFRIASGEMFGPDCGIELGLIDVPEEMPAVDGVMMELQDCAFPLLKKLYAASDPNKGFDGADWALLVGSVPRKAGMERGDLLQINGKIFVDQGRALDAAAKKNCRVLVVGNPCNTNAFIAKAVCRRIPEKNFFAMTLLDQNRAAAQLALKAGVDVGEVSHMAVWGNHSVTQYPDFYNAKIQGRPVLDVVSDEEWLQKDFLSLVQKRGASVIAARGMSSAASAANAVIGTVQKLMAPSVEGEFFSVAVSSDGSYGIEKGLMFSFPVRSNGETWEIVQGMPLHAFSRQKIAETEAELQKEREIVKRVFL